MEFKELIFEFNKNVQDIKLNERDVLKRASEIIMICKRSLLKLNQIVSENKFSEDTEINFFKQIKSIPFHQLILYSEIRSLETSFPKGGFMNQKKYLEKNLKRINKFYIHNMDFVQYVEKDSTYLDAIYFTRKNSNLIVDFHTNIYYRTPNFSTSHDMLLANVLAYDKFLEYLTLRLHKLPVSKKQRLQDIQNSSKLKWTSSKVALTELIYALHSSGAINKGQADLKELAALLENVFNLKLGDYYRSYLEIKMRKAGHTKFLDNLKESLEKRILEKEV